MIAKTAWEPETEWPAVVNDRPSWVLSGGGGLGAYEVGVVLYVATRILPEIGFDGYGHLVGTSVGAINAAFLAATANDPAAGAHAMAETWRSLDVRQILPIHAWAAIRSLFGAGAARGPKGALADPTPITELVLREIKWLQKRRNFTRRLYGSLAMVSTRVDDGRSVVFYESHCSKELLWTNDPLTVASRESVGPSHVLCSAAFPFLFPPGRLNGRAYSDGGIRYNTPLGPVFRLGARRIIAITLDSAKTRHSVRVEREQYMSSPIYLAGKMLSALLVDQADTEIGRARMLNDILAHGYLEYGADFVHQFANVTRKARGNSIHPTKIVHLRPSEDTGNIAQAAAYRILKRPHVPKVLKMLIARLAADPDNELLSVFLLDGEFAGEFIRLGMDDARRQHAEIVDTLAGDLFQTPVDQTLT